MHPEILTKEQTELLPSLKPYFTNFGLVGGTAIALHFGHRRSIDFDLFNFKIFSAKRIKANLKKNWPIDHTYFQAESELTILVNKVKLTFFQFPYKIPYQEKYQNIFRMPNLLTLAAMKAFALGKRAKWKDYVDLYFLLKKFDFNQIVKEADNLFKAEFNEKLFRAQLAYHDDIDYSEKVEFLPGYAIPDQIIKSYLKDISLN
jgi:hypothetical protein